MYYENRKNKLQNVRELTLEEQVDKIKTLDICHAVKINNVIWVNDENPSGCGIKEVAVLIKRENKYYKFESITVDWCEVFEIKHFLDVFSDEERIIKNYNIDFTNPIKLTF